MQPPHFREPMSAEMRSQLIETYPEFLDLDDSRKLLKPVEEKDSIRFGEKIMKGLSAFLERRQESFEEFWWKPMKRDFVVCPICYHFLSDRMLEDEEDDEDEKQEDEDEFDYRCRRCVSDSTNPIDVVISRGRDVGSYAVQTTMAQMKKHLRKAHNIEQSSLQRKSGINELLQRYKLRSGDGLVQMYVC